MAFSFRKCWENLWVAGRCNSSDVKVHGAIRDQPACFMIGEAAGTAAVQSIRTGQSTKTTAAKRCWDGMNAANRWCCNTRSLPSA